MKKEKLLSVGFRQVGDAIIKEDKTIQKGRFDRDDMTLVFTDTEMSYEIKTNEEAIPYKDYRYYCKTCGNPGICNAKTGYCFICDQDNWEPATKEERGKFLGIGI